MSKKMYWTFGALAIIIVGFVALQILLHINLENSKDDITGSPKVETETEQSKGHNHVDGTFHEGTHEDLIPGIEVPPDMPDEPKVKYKAPEGAVLKPDFPVPDPTEDPVKAAYKRLEYIKNNPYAWGGVHSPRATELIAELMPPPELIDHNHGDEVLELIDELCRQGDPRAAAVLIANMCEGDIVGMPMTDALETIGPPAVSYLLLYLDRYVAQGGTTSIGMFDALGRVGARYRSDLGGIVNHIIIPKLEVIAADKDNVLYDSGSVIDAREALDKLQKNIKE